MGFEGGGRYLPEELQEKIQIRLPFKSFVRLESVCKTWQSRFADLYNLLRGGRFDLPCAVPTLDLHSMVPGYGNPLRSFCARKNSVLGSGVLCLVSIIQSFSSTWIFTHSISSFKFVLLNPVTGNHIVPNPIPPQLSSAVPPTDPSEVLFGFGSHNHDYRVVVLIRYGPNLTSSLVLVYSLLSGEWKKTTSVVPRETRLDKHWSNCYLFLECFVSGCWHWVIILDDGTHRVLSFNFGDEKFMLIGMPEPPQIAMFQRIERQTFVLKERLAVMDMVYWWPILERLDVWVMTEYGAEESWSRVCRISPFKYKHVRNFVRIDCVEDETSAAGFVVGSIVLEAWMERGYDYEIICWEVPSGKIT